ncbi:hypothetical protein MSG28_010189 [Choristoneura fumiferana]|uniref:Uncharacterized protein n=1 Tax=Choristoneura fumiferana TaxID=7141 RepID=A0ACC0KJK4_CHOFU|nr:hypothetical protein MSG28_010189 [Choristoneura fumiferana]
MRRARDGYQYQPIPRVATDDAIAHENDQMAEELGSKISTLKHMSIEIGNEVRYQDKILRGLDDDVDRMLAKGAARCGCHARSLDCSDKSGHVTPF